MGKKEIYLTSEGAINIKEELQELTGPRRADLAKRLRNAISMGDLKENAEYITAKEDQAFLEGKIAELQQILKIAIVVEGHGGNEQVSIGSTVVVIIDGEEPQTYKLVGIKEADPRNGKISNESPIGRSLMGKRAGDITNAETPGGNLVMEIQEIL
ncbi:MAG: transcription elongation factor GreA [Anaerolineales bacterium]|nr:transcription elongation factor GreA [Anaerolineales bacterium]MCK5633790.1 transcription elongation factor GreA [Anaerolineales bacterium]